MSGVRAFGVTAGLLVGLCVVVVTCAVLTARWYEGDELVYLSGQGSSIALRAYDIAHGVSAWRMRAEWESWQGFNGSPSWSSDGTTVAFTANRGTGAHVLFLDADSNRPRSLDTLSNQDIRALAWSPNKRYVAYTQPSEQSYQVLYIRDITTEQTRQITVDTTNAFAPTWSADGRKLAFSWSPVANQEIYVINANETAVPVSNASRLQRLTFDYNNDTMPAWSPDNRWIAFVSDRSGNSEIYVMDTQGENMRRLTNDPARDADPQWSPDGQWIVYASIRENQWELFIIETRCVLSSELPDDCTPRTLRLTYNGVDDRSAVWRPRLHD